MLSQRDFLGSLYVGNDFKWITSVSGQVWSEDVLMTVAVAFSIISCGPFYRCLLSQQAPIIQPWKPLPPTVQDN